MNKILAIVVAFVACASNTLAADPYPVKPVHTIARSSGVNRFLLDMQHLPDSIESKGVASTGLHHPDPDFYSAFRPCSRMMRP